MRKLIIILTLAFAATVYCISAADDNVRYSREVLSNGLTIIIKHNPDSRKKPGCLG